MKNLINTFFNQLWHSLKISNLMYVLVFLMITTLSKLTGQSVEIPCNDIGAIFTGDPEETLCDQYSDLSHLIQLGDKITKSSQIGHSLSGQNVHIVDDFIIDNAFSFTNCIIKIDPGVKIQLQSPTDASVRFLFIINNSKLFACEGLWKGIEMATKTSILVKNGTIIEDAEKAIKAENVQYCGLYIENTNFNRNVIGIYLFQNTITSSAASINRFNKNLFSCTAPLNGTTDQIGDAGVWISQNQVVTLYPTSEINGNYFENMKYGIYVAGSSTIKGRYLFFNKLKYGIFNGGGYLDLYGSAFYDCDIDGINFQNIMGLNLNLCNFYYDEDLTYYDVSGNFRDAIDLRSFPTGSNCRITNCRFESNQSDPNKMVRGIAIDARSYFRGGVSILIEDNYWDIISSGSYGIWFEGTTPSNTKVEINHNEFSIKSPEGTYSGNVISLVNGNKNGFIITNNTITISEYFVGPWSDAFQLIGSEGKNNYFVSNHFPSPGGAYLLTYLTGFGITNFDNSIFCSNDFYGPAIAFVATGANELTNIYNTDVNAGAIIDLFPNSFIDQQKHNGNTWEPNPHFFNPNFLVYASPQAKCENPIDAQYSNFIVHTVQSTDVISPGLKPYHPRDIDPDDDDEFWYYQFGVPAVCLEDRSPEFPTRLKKDIADGVFGNYYDSSFTWQAERGLYRTLMQNSDSISSYSGFSSFISSHINAPIGKLYVVEESLDSLLSSNDSIRLAILKDQYIHDSLMLELPEIDSTLDVSTDSTTLANTMALKLALNSNLLIVSSNILSLNELNENYIINGIDYIRTINDNINPTNSWEGLEKYFYDIYMNLLEKGSLDSKQIDTLSKISSLCPKDFGMTIYFARSILPGCNKFLSDYYEDCYLAPEPFQLDTISYRSETLSGSNYLINYLNLEKINLYPNPTSGTVKYDLPFGVISKINVYSPAGKVVNITTLPTNQELDLTLVNSGVYWIQFLLKDGTRKSEKLVIIR